MKKKILILTSVAAFAVMLSLNVTTSINGTDFSLAGAMALASGNTGPCGTCDYDSGTNLEFCNFNWPGTCGGNDGGYCGGVACGE